MFATTLIVGIMASARKTNGYAQGALVNKLLAIPWQTMYKIHSAAIWKKYVSKGTHDLADLYASATALETCVPNFKTTMAKTNPTAKTARPAAERVAIPGMDWVIPGKPRTIFWTTRSTMAPTSKRTSGGSIE
jgi:hypothetical protein